MKDLSNKIYLLGMPGSGKSILGTELSVILGYHFYDLDVEIEVNKSLSIAEFFKQQGAKEFRKVERNNLIKLTNKRRFFLMSTGGGTPCYYNNIDFMNKNGTTVFINTDINKIIKRVLKQQGKRPMFSNVNENQLTKKMYALFEKRHEFYKKSQIIVEGDDINIKSIAYKLLDVQN